VLDAHADADGLALLRDWVLHPLRSVERSAAPGRRAELVGAPFLREELRELLEACTTSSARGQGSRPAARTGATRGAGELARPLPRMLERARGAPLAGAARCSASSIRSRTSRADPRTLVDEPPLRAQGGRSRAARLLAASSTSCARSPATRKSWMARFQAEESARSGIPGLKIGFNSVFGYYIEVPRGQIERVPPSYVRKQTVKAAERYVTAELRSSRTRS
jgi:DNA mismatch repair protein MutS